MPKCFAFCENFVSLTNDVKRNVNQTLGRVNPENPIGHHLTFPVQLPWSPLFRTPFRPKFDHQRKGGCYVLVWVLQKVNGKFFCCENKGGVVCKCVWILCFVKINQDWLVPHWKRLDCRTWKKRWAKSNCMHGNWTTTESRVGRFFSMRIPFPICADSFSFRLHL